MRDCLNFSSLSYRLVDSESSLTIYKVCSENSINQSGFSETSLTCFTGELARFQLWDRKTHTDDDDVELESSFKQFPFDLISDRIETDIRGQSSNVGLKQ